MPLLASLPATRFDPSKDWEQWKANIIFHLLQNLLGYLKEIFKEEMPAKFYIREGQILDTVPEKVSKEKIPDNAFLNAKHYNNLSTKKRMAVIGFLTIKKKRNSTMND